MSKITRSTQVIFGTTGNVGSGGFGAAAGGNVATALSTSTSLSTIQGTTEYVAGWLSATLGASKFPAIEDLNALFYANTSQLAYLFQEGIPEYDAGTTYYQYSICMNPGTFQLYGSLTNANVGNALSDPTNWTLLADFSGGERIRLAGAKTFYVNASTGSDSNTGLTIGSPWQTITHALAIISQNYDLNNQGVTIQLADSVSYVNGGCTTPWVGGSPANITINGNSGTPSNVVVAGLFANNMNTGFNVQNLKLVNGSGAGVNAGVGAQINLGTGMVFGACSGPHINAQDGGSVNVNTAYTINGAAPEHYNSSISSIITIANIAVTVSGTPAFSTAFAQAATSGGIFANASLTFSGSATGVRYNADINGWIATQSGGANFFPGNSAGTTSTGGQYT